MGQALRVIAILDDEEAYRCALSRLLKAHGYDAVSFSAGQQLIAETARRRFDCVLLDLHMPGMTGFDVLETLRAMPAAPPVIVITAHDEPECVQRARALNAFECQIKPVASPVLLGAIERACARSAGN
ncbi:MAG TPA: response regulator [Burkholderiaceae bacterium]|nr:response regulator [Burkholderiaceae bacterium]